MLMAFYCLSVPPSIVNRKENYKYVVIEEPEMGLHPKAIISVILQIIELIKTGGYQVVISSHSPVFLEFAWAFNLLKTIKQRDSALCELFDIPEGSPASMILSGLFEKTIKTYYFNHSSNDKVDTTDISSLDAGATDDMISEWGGISSFATKTSEIVSKYLTNDD